VTGPLGDVRTVTDDVRVAAAGEPGNITTELVVADRTTGMRIQLPGKPETTSHEDP
jgi:hypothetical protein